MVVFDVVEDILLRLAVHDLIRYKSVCKSWYSLISSSRFVKAYLNHTCDNNDYDFGHRRIAMPRVWKIPDETHERLYDYQNNVWKLVGSSNGLVCISTLFDHRHLILVNNPCTREVRELPMAPLVSEKSGYDITLSFGYDSSTDDYKVILGIKKRLEGAIVHVFSLKSNSWKLVGDVKYWFMYDKPGILFNGALHWFVFDYTREEPDNSILSFDLSREEFNLIPQPNDTKYVLDYFDSAPTLWIVENQLCIILTNIDNHLNRSIWVMRSYKNDELSWELLPNDFQMKYDVVHYMKMYDCTSPMKKRLSFFCNNNTCSSRSGEHVDAHIFVQSLVSPYVNNERPSHAGSDKVAELERKCMRRHMDVKSKCIRDPEEVFKEVEEIYRREGGDNEKFFLHANGEPKRKKIKCTGIKKCSRRREIWRKFLQRRGCHSITMWIEGGMLGRKKKNKKNKTKK